MFNTRNRGKIPLFPLLIFFYIPLIAVILAMIGDSEGNFWTTFKDQISSQYLRALFIFSIKQAVLSTLLSLLVAIPVAALFVHYDFPLKKSILSFSMVSFLMPPILVVLGFVLFWGNSGFLNSALIKIFNLDEPPLRVLYSLKAILIAHVFYNYPLALRLIYQRWSNIDKNQLEAAKSLGSNRFFRFRTVILPQISSSIISSSLLIFLYCFMSFAIVLVLGGGPKFSTLEVEVYRQIKLNINFLEGGTLALIETLVTVIILILYFNFEKQEKSKSHISDNSYINPRKAKSLFPIVSVILFYLFFLLLTIAPLVSVVVNSFIQRTSRSGELGFTLKWYMQLLSFQGSVISIKALVNSIIYGIGTMILGTIIGSISAYLIQKKKVLLPKLTEFMILLPLGISSVVLASGWLWLSTKDILLGGKLAIIAAHTFLALPFIYRTISSEIQKLDPNLYSASLSLGEKPLKSIIKIDYALLKKAIFNGALFGFALSIGEVNSALILSSSDNITLPIAIYRLIGSYNYFGACALGTIIMIISYIAFSIIDRAGGLNEN